MWEWRGLSLRFPSFDLLTRAMEIWEASLSLCPLSFLEKSEPHLWSQNCLSSAPHASCALASKPAVLQRRGDGCAGPVPPGILSLPKSAGVLAPPTVLLLASWDLGDCRPALSKAVLLPSGGV